mgnify:CR=1 FL=1
MSKECEKIFFELIRAAVWQRDAVIDNVLTAETWHEVIQSFKAHAMLGLAADAIMSLPAQMRPPETECNEIRRYVGTLVQEHYRQDTVISQLFDTFATNGIDAVLLKGQGIAALYPMTNTRSIGDIDIFVGMEQYTDAMRVASAYCGVEKETAVPTADNIHGSLEVRQPEWLKGVELEIHYKAADTAIPSIKEEYNRWAAEMMHTGPFRIVNISGTELRTPGGAWGVVYVFEHLLKHLRYEGVGYRQFVDWMLCLDAMEDNYDELGELLRRFQLMDAWQVLGGVLVWQLGYDAEKFPYWNERKARYSQGRNLRYITDSANLGAGTAQAKGYYYMHPSLLRRLKAVRYYARYLLFEYQQFPHDTIGRQVRRLLSCFSSSQANAI